MAKQEASGHGSRAESAGKLVLLVVLLLLTSFSALSFSSKLVELNEPDQPIERLEQAIQDLRSTLSVDSVRQYNIGRITAIIDRYNPSLAPETKRQIANTIYEMSLKYANLSVDLICATITQESGWKPDAVSSAGAMGLMQIMPTTGLFLARAEGLYWTDAEDVLFDPVYSIRLGCRYLSALIELYGIEGGLAAYNSGERRAVMWLASNRDNSVLLEETRNYVPSILGLLKRFESEDGLM